MQKVKYQSGSAHIVIIMCVVLALVAALGWIFWQNLTTSEQSQSKAESTDANASSKQNKPANSTLSTCLRYEKLCFEYPTNWTVIKTSRAGNPGEGIPDRDEAVIHNAAGEEMLTVESGVSGLGGACSEDTDTYLNIYESEVTKVSGLLSDDEQFFSDTVFAVEASYNDPDEGSVPYVYLSNSTLTTKIGKYVTCLPELAGIFKGKIPNTSVSFSSQIRKGDDLLYEKSESRARDILKSEDYTAAYEILKSVYYK